MITTAKKSKGATLSRTKIAAAKNDVQSGDKDKLENIPIELIDISPLNYRKYYDPDALDKFAEELAIHGIISSLTVRVVKKGRYELVAGERRFRGAQIAKLKHLPAVIRTLTDQQVREIQLAENLQRENPHPLHESLAIAQMQQDGLNNDEIATRLGKSKTFVYSRIKLAALIEPIQLIFLANKFTIQEAFTIAAIDPESQQEFFDSHCKDWQKKDFQLYNLSGILNKFRYNLKRAPFETKDKNLLPEIGACTKCPYNSAVLKTLFPEMAKEAVCTNKSCYQNKCNAHLQRLVYDAIEQYNPVAIIGRNFSESVCSIITAHPVAKDLPVFDTADVTTFNPPSVPDQEDYTDNWAEDDDPDKFEQEEYEHAVNEYKADLEEYNHLKETGKASVAIFISENEVSCILFNTEKRQQRSGSTTVTSKQVQEAIKNGTVTAELLQGEMIRLQAKEVRSKQLDREKVQLKLHQQFTEQFSVLESNESLTAADNCAARLIIFNSLDYSTQRKVKETLFPAESIPNMTEQEEIYTVLSTLTEQQFAYLIRMALACKSESKTPNSVSAYTLYQVAESSGTNVQLIEQEQQAILETRELRLNQRVTEMQKRLERINSVV
ncbi:MAG: ParB/RepB/Spo0J family partition protein [Candidatus Pedobacter colombiensis]|uniref:ParB/RepB/Spo0J family partition protein n=1 Tax=Candidatus Pedobacter colombiensis TaxID=3121371 RepID=A0AAJ5WB42_9SPHI|nr:ParB/RepB/Spo0J family partition protein [Pedobacter sp.]WEK21322.1 MAG: ParB/RepB/Spo0J family partition protein [Pedobacter sp.]